MAITGVAAAPVGRRPGSSRRRPNVTQPNKMGALPTESPSVTIQHAISQKRRGNALPYNLLQHTLSGRDPSAIAQVLRGLTHFAAISHTAHSTDASDLTNLISHALTIDLKTCSDKTASTALRPALREFLTNLISADAAYIDDVLRLAAKAFSLPLDGAASVVDHLHDMLPVILQMYPRAGPVMLAVIRDCYPHPVRPSGEHHAYARSVLQVSRQCVGHPVGHNVISCVFEKLGAVEALLTQEVFIEDDKGEKQLAPQAEKLDLVLLELFNHVQLAHSSKHFVSDFFEPLYSAYESSIVPIENVRYSPYSLIFAASIAGPEILQETIDRLLLCFLDPRLHTKLRVKFLQQSSILVIRAAKVSSEAARSWVSRVAKWLNAYVDAQQRHPQFMSEVDTSVHGLFYSAVFALMTTVVNRRYAFAGGDDFMDQLRLLRIMSCGMNPLLILPPGIVEEFSNVMFQACGMDFSDIRNANVTCFAPSFTKYGTVNKFSDVYVCPELDLPQSRQKLGDLMRVDNEEVHDDTISVQPMIGIQEPEETGALNLLQYSL